MSEINNLIKTLVKFRDERDWAQFHSLKNLIVSLNLEASELLELAQWKSDETLESLKSDEVFKGNLEDECADVFLYLLLIANHTGINLINAANEKIKKNAARYPIHLSRGSAQKYSALEENNKTDPKK